MWFFTVFSLMNSCFAMSRLLSPCATSRSTSISRSVSRGAGMRGCSSADFDIAANSVSSFDAMRRRDARLPGPDAADRVGDLLDRDLLQQVAAGARLDRVVEVALLVADREHQDLAVRKQLLDLARRLDAGSLRHADVHEHDVGHGLLRPLDGLGAVGGLADELDVGFLLQHHLEPAPEQRVIVDHHHPELLGRLVRILASPVPLGLSPLHRYRQRGGALVSGV